MNIIMNKEHLRSHHYPSSLEAHFTVNFFNKNSLNGK